MGGSGARRLVEVLDVSRTLFLDDDDDGYVNALEDAADVIAELRGGDDDDDGNLNANDADANDADDARVMLVNVSDRKLLHPELYHMFDAHGAVRVEHVVQLRVKEFPVAHVDEHHSGVVGVVRVGVVGIQIPVVVVVAAAQLRDDVRGVLERVDVSVVVVVQEQRPGDVQDLHEPPRPAPAHSEEPPVDRSREREIVALKEQRWPAEPP